MSICFWEKWQLFLVKVLSDSSKEVKSNNKKSYISSYQFWILTLTQPRIYHSLFRLLKFPIFIEIHIIPYYSYYSIYLRPLPATIPPTSKSEDIDKINLSRVWGQGCFQASITRKLFREFDNVLVQQCHCKESA